MGLLLLLPVWGLLPCRKGLLCRNGLMLLLVLLPEDMLLCWWIVRDPWGVRLLRGEAVGLSCDWPPPAAHCNDIRSVHYEHPGLADCAHGPSAVPIKVFDM